MLACSHRDIDAKCQPCGTFPAQPDTPRPLYRSGVGPHFLGHRAEPHAQDGGNPNAGRARSVQVSVGTAWSRLQLLERLAARRHIEDPELDAVDNGPQRLAGQLRRLPGTSTVLAAVHCPTGWLGGYVATPVCVQCGPCLMTATSGWNDHRLRWF